MELFKLDTSINLLPNDGIVHYFGQVLTPLQAKKYYQQLMDTASWKNDEVVIFGKHITTKRMVAWYGDSNFSYTYSNTTKQASVWSKELLELKTLAEDICQTSFNSCLLNLYHDGTEGMGWHSDNEKSLQNERPIASLSLGAERKFLLKHKQTKASVSVILQSGSLLAMRGATQTNWVHSLPKSTRVSTPRINLTFRSMVL